MRYSLIRSMDISNGEGVGVSLFVQGCPLHCEGCFNQETWDFNGGKEFTDDVKRKFLELAGKPFVQRISFLGGEPLCDENVFDVVDLISNIKMLYPEKKIWIYTGYKWEGMSDIKKNADVVRVAALWQADVVCDGRFILSKQDINHKQVKWVGSTNQRIIDTHKTFEIGEVVEYKTGVK